MKGCFALFLCCLLPINGKELEKVKGKRGTVEQYIYANPEVIKQQYPDTTVSGSGNFPPVLPRHLPYHPHQDPLKQVTAQQVSYEYQQTPHTTLSNVQFNQQFGPLPDAEHSQTNFPIYGQETANHFSPVASPVQHGAAIHHHVTGPGYTKLYHPIPVPNNNNNNKYLYVNGKIVYHPPGTLVNPQPYPGIAIPARTYNLPYRPYVQQKPFKPSPLIPSSFNSFNQFPITTTTTTSTTSKPEIPVKEQEEEEQDEELREEDEDEEEQVEEEDGSYEEDEDDDSPHDYSEEDEEDHSYQDEEEEDAEDTKTHSVQLPKNKGKNYNTYKYRDYNSRRKQVPKSHYKTYRYYKSASNVAPKFKKLDKWTNN